MANVENFPTCFKKIYAAVFLGPIFVFCTTALSYHEKINESIFLLGICGLGFVWAFPKNALRVIASIMLMQFFYFFFLPHTMSLWYLGLRVSMFASLMIASLGVQEFYRFLQTYADAQHLDSYLQEWKQVCFTLQKDLFAKNEEAFSLEEEHASLSVSYEALQEACSRKDLVLSECEKNQQNLQNSLEQLQAEVICFKKRCYAQQTELQESKKRLDACLQKPSRAPEQTLGMNFSLRKQLQELQQRFAQKTQDFQLVSLHCDQIKKFEPMYFQLKEQFSEKNSTLQQARKQLFRAEETIILLEKKLEEKSYVFSGESRSLLEESAQLSEQLTLMQQQEEALFSLIDYLHQEILRLTP